MNRDRRAAEGIGIGIVSAEELTKLSGQLVGISEHLDRIAAQPRVGPKTAAILQTPEERLERALIVQSMLDTRDRCFGDDGSLFGDPAFDILLLLYVSALRKRAISISAAASAGQLKSTTGLRWLNNLNDRGLIDRTVDTRDARRSIVSLTDRGMAAMNRYIDALRL